MKMRLIHFLLWLNQTSSEILLMLLILQQQLLTQDQDSLACSVTCSSVICFYNSRVHFNLAHILVEMHMRFLASFDHCQSSAD